MRTAIPTIGEARERLVRETRAGAEQHPSLGDRTARESARGRGVGAATPGVRDEVAETGGGHASTPRVPARPAPPAFSRLSSRPFSQERGCAWCGARYEIRVHFDRDCAEVR